jgi:hypothetical protein
MDHEPWSMVQDRITERNNMTKAKTLNTEFLPGGSRRQELDNAVAYLRKPVATHHEFCLPYLKLTETEYLEALNKELTASEELMELKQISTEERKNRFSGESIMLTPAEAKIHDEIFYYEYLATLEDKKVGVDGHSKLWDKVRKGLITLDSTMLRLTWFC